MKIIFYTQFNSFDATDTSGFLLQKSQLKGRINRPLWHLNIRPVYDDQYVEPEGDVDRQRLPRWIVHDRVMCLQHSITDTLSRGQTLHHTALIMFNVALKKLIIKVIKSQRHCNIHVKWTSDIYHRWRRGSDHTEKNWGGGSINVRFPSKVSACYVHLCIWYCDITL